MIEVLAGLSKQTKVMITIGIGLVALIGWFLLTWYAMIKTSDIVKSMTRATAWILTYFVITISIWLVLYL